MENADPQQLHSTSTQNVEGLRVALPLVAPKTDEYAQPATSFTQPAPSFTQQAPSFTQQAPSFTQQVPSFAQPTYDPNATSRVIHSTSSEQINTPPTSFDATTTTTTTTSYAGEAPAPTGQRSCGVVKWFNPTKGFGFITPKIGGPDVFVHQSEIQLDGFRSLAQGEFVEFFLITGEKGPKALKVTGPNGTEPKGAPRVQKVSQNVGYPLVEGGTTHKVYRSNHHGYGMGRSHHVPLQSPQQQYQSTHPNYLTRRSVNVPYSGPLSPKFVPYSPTIPMVLESPVSTSQFTYPVSYPMSPIAGGVYNNFSFPTTPTQPAKMSSTMHVPAQPSYPNGMDSVHQSFQQLSFDQPIRSAYSEMNHVGLSTQENPL